MSGGLEDDIVANINLSGARTRVEISRKHLGCLRPRQWLNDHVMPLVHCLLSLVQVIQTYIFMVVNMRGDVGNMSLPRVGVTKNSFFYERLSDEGHNAVKTWTDKELFGKAKLFVPINKDKNHWVSGSIS